MTKSTFDWLIFAFPKACNEIGVPNVYFRNITPKQHSDFCGTTVSNLVHPVSEVETLITTPTGQYNFKKNFCKIIFTLYLIFFNQGFVMLKSTLVCYVKIKT